MISVLHLTSSFGLGGGAETNLVRLVGHMDRSRLHNVVVTMTDGIGHDLLRSRLARADVPIYSLGMRRGVPNLSAVVRLVRILRKVRPDILQTWMYHADLLGLLVGKIARVPSIAWNIRCSSMGHQPTLSTLVLRMLIPLSSLPHVVLANSQSGIRAHKALGYKPRRWVYIPNSLDLDEFRPDPEARNQVRRELELPQDAPIIGLVARFHPMKDHANFVAAASLLAADDPRIHFVLVGRGVDSANVELTRWVESTGARHRFHLLGHRLDISRITAGLDIGCSSSASEGSSNALAEAMACGVPCVATDVGDSSLIVQNTGVIVPPKQPQAFARACHGLINLTLKRREELGLAARKRIEECFSVPSVVLRYQGLYEQLTFRFRDSMTEPEVTAGSCRPAP